VSTAELAPPAAPAATPEAPSAAAAANSRLRALVVAGMVWKLVSQGFRQTSRLVVALILARLLSPADFGIAAEVIVFSSLVIVFADLAFGAALIQREEVTDDDCSTAFWACAATGLGFTLLGIALAGPIAAFYGEPQVKPLVMALSVTFLLTSVSTIQESLLARDLAFRALETRLMAATVVGAVVGIGAAALGWGAWAVILQSLTLSLCSSALLWAMSPWRPRLRFSWASLRSMASFSGYLFGHRLLYYLHRNSDNLLIGKALGPASLGAYAIAYNIILVPFSRIAAPLQDVLFPAFSRIQGDKARIADGWIRVTRAVAAISIPALAGLALLADDFVTVVLGPKWSAAAPVIQILAWVGALQALQSLNTGILEALGHARAIFRWTIVFFACHLVAFVVGLHWGMLGVATGYAISTTIVEPSYLRLTSRAVGISPWRFLRALTGVAWATLGMAVVVAAARWGLVEVGAPALVRLVLCTLAGVAAYVPLCAWRAPEVLAEVRSARARRRGRVGSGTAPAEATA
jgi:O-antigen/teichoic acid export membrane protein